MIDNWDNKEPIGIRTKIALKVLLLMFKILAPYQFEHRFEKDLKQISDDIMGIQPEREVKDATN